MVTLVEQPIICSPFQEPSVHWKIEPNRPTRLVNSRRRASYYYRIPEHSGTGRRNIREQDFFEENVGEEIELELVSAIRRSVSEWRNGGLTGTSYDGITEVTRDLLNLWYSDDRRDRLFFAQLEAVESVIFLIESSPVYRRNLPSIPIDEGASTQKNGEFFTRYALKMATGTGKTTVMGMLAAWSILNKVYNRRDNRFSENVLIVCPNVTIRERLKELDPRLGQQSLYVTRELIPIYRLNELRRGTVLVTNWHRLAKKEINSVNGITSKVVKTGVAVSSSKRNKSGNVASAIKYVESDLAWFQRVTREFGSEKIKKSGLLVFNDEAHHAYRLRDRSDDQRNETEDDGVKRNRNNENDLDSRESTVWVEGLDRINNLANGKRKGINFCVDLSATPFYLQGSGNEVGKPFPWIVSDFGLLEAIESGLVKVPQITAGGSDNSQRAAYFNIWRWTQEKAAEDGHSRKLAPDIVLKYASQPIILIAEDWNKKCREWQDNSDETKDFVPPVLIIVCRDTALAKEVYEWIAEGSDRYGRAPSQFKNNSDKQVTVRIDSRAVEDIDKGGTKDETKKLRFILETIGRTSWLGGIIPKDWSELVSRNNEKVENDQTGNLRWIDEEIPPGRDIKCIVSVSMLTEGWDANTVTHVIGLRPFGSQLLCEQVVGRALRRKAYVLDEVSGLFSEEVATVLGVPFELVPFKVAKDKKSASHTEIAHIFTDQQKEEYEITVPFVTRYMSKAEFDVEIDWELVSQVTIDPRKTPQHVEIGPMTSPSGSLVGAGPPTTSRISLEEWRKSIRLQEIAFRLAKEVCNRWKEEKESTSVPAQTLFPKVLNVTFKFLSEKVITKGDSQIRDILASGEYVELSVDRLFEAIKLYSETKVTELPVIPSGSAGQRSTSHIDFYTKKRTFPAKRCHLNLMVADTKTWEQNAGATFDSHPGIRKWVKNDRLDFWIPYRFTRRLKKYYPDFLVETDKEERLIVEVKGDYDDFADAKSKAALRWVRAVNNVGEYGHWSFLVATDPNQFGIMLDMYCKKKWENTM